MRRESGNRRGMRESGWDLLHVLMMIMVLGLLAFLALMTYFLVTDNPALQEQSRQGEPIREMIVSPVDVTAGPIAF
ncbi:MAG TPA: hypothetical protein VF303_03515 [Candidatus Nanoarchaeia archaeon]